MFRPYGGAYGAYGGYGGHRGRRRGVDMYLAMMLAQMFNQIYQLEQKPPVTLAIMAACFATFFDDFLPTDLQRLIPSVNKACLQPYMIWRNRQWSRLIWSAFLHADEYHLYYNMSSLLWKGVQLEQRYGSMAFAGLVVELLVLSHALVVGATAMLAYYIPEYRCVWLAQAAMAIYCSYLYLTNCSIGISAVLFGLKVVLNHDSPGFTNFFGISLPTKYMAWAELLLASAFNPRASFMGHLAGIAAGLLHVKLLSPGAADFLRWWRRMQIQARVHLNPGQPHFATASGIQNSRAAGASAAAAAAAAGAARGGIDRGARRQPATGPAAAVPASSGTSRDSSWGPAVASAAQQHRPRFAASNEMQQSGAVEERDLNRAGAETLSAEELRRRRLQRFG